MSRKKKTALFSVFSNILLTTLKLGFGFIAGSVSLLSEALHSFGDLIASLIAFGSLSESSKPADEHHQFGHGKFEDLAGFIEALLIILTALFILYVGFEKLIVNGNNYTFNADIAFFVILASGIINYFVARYLIKNGELEDSNALLGDGYHLMADVYSSFAVGLGMLLVKITGYYVLDIVMAVIAAVMILRTGISLLKKTADNLLDCSLPSCELGKIQNILEEFKNLGVSDVKSIKTSKSGSLKNIVLVIYLPCRIPLIEAHKLCDMIESRIEKELKNTNVVIHAEPNSSCLNKNKCEHYTKANSN